MGRSRTWSDDDLRHAIRSSRSWGQVVGSLGLAHSSSAYKSVQGHALRLQVDIGHLSTPGSGVGPRSAPDYVPVTRELLASAVERSLSWRDVLRCLGRDPLGGGSIQTVKRLAKEFGLSTGHLSAVPWVARPVDVVPTPFTGEPDDVNLRKASAALATAWFMHRGYIVSVPVEPARYDLVVDSDEGLVRVQVKSTTTKDRDRWIVGIARRRYSSGARSTCGYLAEEIDYFFIVTGDGDKYLIPVGATNGSLNLTLDSKYAGYKV